MAQAAQMASQIKYPKQFYEDFKGSKVLVTLTNINNSGFKKITSDIKGDLNKLGVIVDDVILFHGIEAMQKGMPELYKTHASKKYDFTMTIIFQVQNYGTSNRYETVKTMVQKLINQDITQMPESAFMMNHDSYKHFIKSLTKILE
jgi:hypothetical protein